VPRPISPLSAAFRLLALCRGAEPMSEQDFDLCIEALIDLMERANNEKYQLEPSQNDDDQ